MDVCRMSWKLLQIVAENYSRIFHSNQPYVYDFLFLSYPKEWSAVR